jgi:membrane-bound lytic murein transglycosylase B
MRVRRGSPTRPRSTARLACLAALLLAAANAPAAAEQDFARWLEVLAAEARERGISRHTVETTLATVAPIPRVIELDRSQPRGPSDFCDYMKQRITATRIARGRRILVEQRKLLAEISEDYGVPPRYLVALWGLETNFGDYLGDYPLLDALVTLARNPRRAEFFREQVFAALRIIDEGHHRHDGLMGSWAGATGQLQLMPTTFLEYAVDRDGDGRKDVWASLPDALATAAHYLGRAGWRSGETWGRQVWLPAEVRRKGSRTLSAWQQLGVRRIDGGDLPAADLRARIVLPLRHRSLAFLVYRNYQTFLAWNDSTFFAISVGALADELTSAANLRACGS